jgi:hypothetical protein
MHASDFPDQIRLFLIPLALEQVSRTSFGLLRNLPSPDFRKSD